MERGLKIVKRYFSIRAGPWQIFGRVHRGFLIGE